MRLTAVLFVIAMISAVPSAQAAPAPSGDIDQTVQQTMSDVSKDADNDLKDQMNAVDKENQSKKALRENASRLKPKRDDDKLLPKHANDRLLPKHDNDRLLPKHDNNRLMPKRQGLGLGARNSLNANDLNAKKQNLQDKKDGLGEQSPQDGLQLQQAQERHDKAESSLSRIMRKSQDTNSSLTNNLK